MFGLEPDTFSSSRKTFLACAKLLRALFFILVASLIVLFLIGLRNGVPYLLAERSIWGAYLSGFLTTGSLWWACRWSARRSDD